MISSLVLVTFFLGTAGRHISLQMCTALCNFLLITHLGARMLTTNAEAAN